MAINYAERHNDGRRSKWQKLNESSALLVQQIEDDIARRPEPKFSEGQIVYTPDGYREIVGCYHSGKYWMYRIWNRYSTNYAEHELAPIFFNKGDLLKLPSGVLKVVHNICITKSGQLLLLFEIRPKCFTAYTYEVLLKLNPPIHPELFQCLYQYFVEDAGDKKYCTQMISQIAPSLAI